MSSARAASSGYPATRIARPSADAGHCRCPQSLLVDSEREPFHRPANFAPGEKGVGIRCAGVVSTAVDGGEIEKLACCRIIIARWCCGVGAAVLEKLLHLGAFIGQPCRGLGNPAPPHVVCVGRQCDRGQDGNDDDDDH